MRRLLDGLQADAEASECEKKRSLTATPNTTQTVCVAQRLQSQDPSLCDSSEDPFEDLLEARAA